MIKLGIGIVHVSSRQERVEALRRCLACLTAPWPKPPSPVLSEMMVSDDPEMLGCLQNAMQIWRHMLTVDGLTHVTILGDDYLPCNDYVNVMGEMLTANPHHLISTYPTHDQAKQLFDEGISWYVTMDGAQTTTIPIPILRDMVRFYDEDYRSDGSEVNEDTFMNLYAYATGRRIFTTTIALVEQQGVPSLLGHGDPQPSHRPRENMLGINWATKGVNFGRVVNGTHMRVLSTVHQKSWEKYHLWDRAWQGQPGYEFGATMESYKETVGL